MNAGLGFFELNLKEIISKFNEYLIELDDFESSTQFFKGFLNCLDVN